tara:strand:- start:72 stop:329 length:258 start_codon:yes stop_codon:yes gene_type:complete
MEITYERVFERLSSTRWVSALEIISELYQGRQNVEWEKVIPILRRMVAEGHVVKRESYDDKKRVKRRGGQPYFVYRITQENVSYS